MAVRCWEMKGRGEAWPFGQPAKKGLLAALFCLVPPGHTSPPPKNTGVPTLLPRGWGMGREVQLADLKRVIQILPGSLTGEDYRKWLIMNYILITLFWTKTAPFVGGL